MNLKNETIEILKTFTGINENIIIYPGNVIRTRTDGGHIISEYECEEDFETICPIFDLKRFLNTIKILGDSASMKFGEKGKVVILENDKKQKIRYGLTPENMITEMDKSVRDFDSVVTLDFTKSISDQIKSSAAALNVEHLSIRSDGKKIMARIHQVDGVGASSKGTDDYYDFQVGTDDSGHTYNFIFEIRTLPAYPGDYTLTIASETFSLFQHKTIPLKHWAAILDESEYSD